MAQQIASALPPVRQCVDSNAGPAQRASFAFFGNVPFAPFGGARCDFLLLQDNSLKRNDKKLFAQFAGRWELLWEGRRPADRDERFRLYRRAQ